MHVAQGKLLIPTGAAPEQGEDLMREEPEAGCLHSADEKGVAEDQIGGLLDAVIVAGTEIEAHNGLAADTAADDRGIKEEIDFGDNAGRGQCFTPPVWGECSVAAERAVENQVHDKHGGLVEAACGAYGGDLGDLGSCYSEVMPDQLSCLEADHVPGDKEGGYDLSRDCRKRGACNSHIEGKEKQVVQNKVERDAGQGTEQGISGASIRADEQRTA